MADYGPTFSVVPCAGIPYIRSDLKWCVVSSHDPGNFHATGFIERESAEAYAELMRSPKPGKRSTCDLCSNPAKHEMLQYGNQFQFCCFHHVQNGNPPADWHDDCLNAWNAMFPRRCYFLTMKGKTIEIERDQLPAIIAELQKALNHDH